MFSTCPSVRSFVCYQTCEHGISKTNEPILMSVGINFGGQKVKRSRSHKVEDRLRGLHVEMSHFG